MWRSVVGRGNQKLSRRLGALLPAALATAVAAAALAAASVPAAVADGVQASGVEIGAAPATQKLQLVLPLAVDGAGLARFASAVSTPGSALYGQYESVQALARRFGASPDTRRRVVRYLRAVGANGVKIDGTGMLAYATMSVGLAERVFGTPLARFRTPDGVRFVAPVAVARVAAARSTVPGALRGLATGVVGLDTQPVVATSSLVAAGAGGRVRRLAAHTAAAGASSALANTGTRSGCAQGSSVGPYTPAFTPNEYLSAFGYAPLQSAGLLGQGERVALIETGGFNDSDLRQFAYCFGIGIPAINIQTIGSNQPLAPGGETTLDLEVLSATAPELSSIDVFEVNGNAERVLQSLSAPLSQPGAKPQVISMSLGLCEAQLAGTPVISAGENELSLAAAAGITFMAVSGDQGSADCAGSNGVSLQQLAIDYPGSSPWATTVGGINLDLNANNTIQNQVVWNDGPASPGAAGGGGFSRHFARPSYQNGVVSENARAVPDVSMLADLEPGYAIYCTASVYCDGVGWEAVGGTSAAAPLLAGGVALADQYLRDNNREYLGFLNPLLYEVGKSSTAGDLFDDVTEGSNDVGPFIPGGSGQPLGCCTAGPGYDEASGWGSVDIDQLAQIAVQVQPKIPNVSLSLPRPQSPVRRHAMKVSVSCSQACDIAVIAEIRFGRSSFEAQSNTYQLPANGSKLIVVGFSAKQERRLRLALAHHHKITTEAFATALNAYGGVLKLSTGKTFKITS